MRIGVLIHVSFGPKEIDASLEEEELDERYDCEGDMDEDGAGGTECRVGRWGIVPSIVGAIGRVTVAVRMSVVNSNNPAQDCGC